MQKSAGHAKTEHEKIPSIWKKKRNGFVVRRVLDRSKGLTPPPPPSMAHSKKHYDSRYAFIVEAYSHSSLIFDLSQSLRTHLCTHETRNAFICAPAQ